VGAVDEPVTGNIGEWVESAFVNYCTWFFSFWCDVLRCCVKCFPVSLESEYEDLMMLNVLNGLPSSFLT